MTPQGTPKDRRTLFFVKIISTIMTLFLLGPAPTRGNLKRVMIIWTVVVVGGVLWLITWGPLEATADLALVTAAYLYLRSGYPLKRVHAGQLLLRDYDWRIFASLDETLFGPHLVLYDRDGKARVVLSTGELRFREKDKQGLAHYDLNEEEMARDWYAPGTRRMRERMEEKARKGDKDL